MRHRLIALANVKAGREKEFETWHDEIHMKEVLDITGFVRAERMVMVPETNLFPPLYRYAVIYEGEGRDLEAAMERLKKASEEGRLQSCDALADPGWSAIFRQVESPDARIDVSDPEEE